LSWAGRVGHEVQQVRLADARIAAQDEYVRSSSGSERDPAGLRAAVQQRDRRFRAAMTEQSPAADRDMKLEAVEAVALRPETACSPDFAGTSMLGRSSRKSVSQVSTQA
jgi:hypothetical protein